jgi:hypothetical protein
MPWHQMHDGINEFFRLMIRDMEDVIIMKQRTISCFLGQPCWSQETGGSKEWRVIVWWVQFPFCKIKEF